jgi:hypothetical protein
MKTTTYWLRLTLEAPIEIPRDVVEKVLDYSTAIEAIEEGIWNWLPADAIDKADDAVNDVFAMGLSIIPEDCYVCGHLTRSCGHPSEWAYAEEGDKCGCEHGAS